MGAKAPHIRSHTGLKKGANMRIVYAVLVVSFMMVLPVFGQIKGELTPEYSKCMDRAAGADPAMLECIGAETARQDKKLNEVYKKLMNELTPERQKQLREAQRLWVKYTEANCDFYYDPYGGTAARLSASECSMHARAYRAKELESLLQP